MHERPALLRLARTLGPVIVVVLFAGVIAAFAFDESEPSPGGGAPGVGLDDGAERPTDALADGADGAEPSDDPGREPSTVTSTSSVPSLGPPAVPQPGTYVFDVVVIRDGSSSTVEEVREITRIDGDDSTGTVRVEVRTDDQRQISTLGWSPTEVEVRSTRVASAAGGGEDCRWDPPVTEFASFMPGGQWSVSSSCQTTVAGSPSTFAVLGDGTVVGEAVVSLGGVDVPVWRVERDRTTRITGTVAGSPVEQEVREQGILFLDPVRGLVVQSDVTVTVRGEVDSVTRRQSTLRV